MNLIRATLIGLVLAAGCANQADSPNPEANPPRQTDTQSLDPNSGQGPEREPEIEPETEAGYGIFPSVPSNAIVEEVIDGDTIEISTEGVRETVRLIGIDTPETIDPNRPEQCYGAEATQYLESLLPEGTPVTIILDVETRDAYGRLLAFVIRSTDSLFVNLAMVASGHAATLFVDPNLSYQSRLSAAEELAKSSGTGLWGACGGPDMPLN